MHDGKGHMVPPPQDLVTPPPLVSGLNIYPLPPGIRSEHIPPPPGTWSLTPPHPPSLELGHSPPLGSGLNIYPLPPSGTWSLHPPLPLRSSLNIYPLPPWDLVTPPPPPPQDQVDKPGHIYIGNFTGRQVSYFFLLLGKIPTFSYFFRFYLN